MNISRSWCPAHTRRGAVAIALVLVCSMFALRASAGDEYAQVGHLYVSANLGVALYEEGGVGDDDLGIGGASFDVKPSARFDLRYGTRVARRLAWEWQFEYAPEFEVDCSCAADGLEGSAFSFGINSKVFALTGRTQPYALLGLGGTRIEGDGISDETGFSIRTGGGVAFHITEHWSVAGEATYIIPFGKIGDYDYVAIGLGAQYQF